MAQCVHGHVSIATDLLLYANHYIEGLNCYALQLKEYLLYLKTRKENFRFIKQRANANINAEFSNNFIRSFCSSDRLLRSTRVAHNLVDTFNRVMDAHWINLLLYIEKVNEYHGTIKKIAAYYDRIFFRLLRFYYHGQNWAE